MTQTTSGQYWVAVDAGGTQLRAARYNEESFEPVQAYRISTRDQEHSPTERLISLIEKVWPDSGVVSAIALAVPGAVNPHEGIVYTSPNIPGWVDLPLRQIIFDHFGVPTAVGNDANIAALGEWKHGAGQGCQNMLYFTVSTGIGGGIIENGRLVLGQRGLAGEVGHITVEPEGTLCGCGQRGHLEAIASGPAIVRWIEQQIASGAESSLSNRSQLTAKDAAAAAASGDRLAKAAFDRAGFWFGRSLADYLHLFNPDIVVIGGGVSLSGELFFAPVRESMKKHVISPRYYEHLTVTNARLGDDAGLIGAKVLAQSIQNSKALLES